MATWITTIPGVSATGPESPSPSPSEKSSPTKVRSSSILHKNLISKLRPLPFQHVWSMWHSKSGTDSSEGLTELAQSIPDIAAFWRIFNNCPWNEVRLRDSVQFFRAGVKPLWEDKENVSGGAWIIKIRRDGGKAPQVWQEVCLMMCGGELQAAVASERDHVLGASYSPRLHWTLISVWNKSGDNVGSVALLQKTILSRLSPELQPGSDGEYYYRKHAAHSRWKEGARPL